MRGILLADLSQTLRSYPKVLALYAVFIIGSKLALGPIGAWVSLLMLVPITAVSTGVGTLGEEYSKGQLRYLYGMAIRPVHLWLIKIASGICSVFELVAFILVLAWITPTIVSPENRFDLLEDFGVRPVSLLVAITSYGLFAYAVGVTAMGFSLSVKTASLLSSIFLYAPALLLLGINALFQNYPSPWAITAVSLGMAALLLGISTAQFFARNPFIDRPWTWAGFGVLSTLLSLGGAALLSLVVALVLPGQTLNFGIATAQQVQAIQTAPDGRHVVAVRSGQNGNALEVLNADGQAVQKLRSDAAMMGYGPQNLLGFSPDGKYLVYQTLPTHFANLRPDNKLFVLDLETGEDREIDHLQFKDPDRFCSYLRWAESSRYLIAINNAGGYGGGFGYGYGVGSRESSEPAVVFRQDIVNNQAQSIEIVEPETKSWQVLRDGRIGITHLDEEGKPAQAEILGWDDTLPHRVELPEETRSVFFSPTGQEIWLVRRPVENDRVRYLIEAVEIETGERRVLLDGSPLPSATLADAVKGRFNPLPTHVSSDGRWIAFNLLVDDHHKWFAFDPATRELRLIYEHKVDINGPYFSGDLVFSPTGSRVYFLDTSNRYAEVGYGDEADPDNPDKSRLPLVVYDLDSPDDPPIYEGKINRGVRDLHWSGEDKLLFVSQKPLPYGGVQCLDLKTGEINSFLGEAASSNKD